MFCIALMSRIYPGVSNQLFDMVGVNRVTLVEEGFEGGNVELADIGGLGATHVGLVAVRML